MTDIDETILTVPDRPTGAKLTREQIALHEAAHAVMAHYFAGGIDEIGIDLQHRSEDGARGGAVCRTLDDMPELDMKERQDRLLRNVMVICAGPACDAKLLANSLEQSLRDQWSDHRNVVNLLAGSQVISRENGDDGRAEMALVLHAGLKSAASKLAQPSIWKSVEAVSTAILGAGGKLTGSEIIDVITTVEANS